MEAKELPSSFALCSEEVLEREGFLGWIRDELQQSFPYPIQQRQSARSRKKAPGLRSRRFAGPDRLSRCEFGLLFTRTFHYEEELLDAPEMGAENARLRAKDVCLSAKATEQEIERKFCSAAVGLAQLRSQYE